MGDTTTADPTVTVVVATVGRPTLARTLASLRLQSWNPGSGVLLLGDGDPPGVAELWRQFRLPGRYVALPDRLGHWGHGARNHALDAGLVTTDLAAACDDDDAFAPDAVWCIRHFGREHPGRPLLFRMDWYDPATGRRAPLWDEPVLRQGNIGTPCLVAPADPARLGRYTPRYGGDFDFIRATCGHYPAGPVWRPEVLCACRPHLAAG